MGSSLPLLVLLLVTLLSKLALSNDLLFPSFLLILAHSLDLLNKDRSELGDSASHEGLLLAASRAPRLAVDTSSRLGLDSITRVINPSVYVCSLLCRSCNDSIVCNSWQRETIE